jgi:P-type conjugative transfer protein TrbG
MWMHRWLMLPLAVLLAGCVAETPPLSSPPLPDDLAIWSTPTPVAEPTPPAPDLEPRPEGPASKAEKVYPFKAGTVYEVPVAVDFPTDIILEAGERVSNIAGADLRPVEPEQPPRWHVKEGQSDTDTQARGHVFIAVTEAKLTTGLTVTTSRRTYYLTCRSVPKTPIRAVRWSYPVAPVEPTPVKAMILPDASQPQRYHVGYHLESSQPAPVWMPRQVVDDGRKVYILLPPQSQYADAPMLRLVGPNGPELVDGRQFKSVLIVDRIFTVAELRLGIGKAAEVVRITRGNPVTITCPGSEACPVWPPAAGTVAGQEAADARSTAR